MNYIRILVITIIPIMLYSCSNSPVEPNETYEYDSARYSWKTDTLSAVIIDNFILDSNNFLLLDLYNTLYRFENGHYTNIKFSDPNVTLLQINGYNNNNIYLGGGDINNNPRLFMLNGLNFTEMVLNDPKNRNYSIANIYPYTPNKIYLGSDKGDIIVIENGNQQYHNTDTISYNDSLKAYINFFNFNNEVYAVEEKFDPLSFSQRKVYLTIYKENIDSWQKIYFNESYIEDSLRLQSFISKNTLYAKKNNEKLKIYSRKDFLEIYDFKFLNPLYFSFEGNNKDFILDIENTDGKMLLCYTKLKFSKELGPTKLPSKIYTLFTLGSLENFYILVYCNTSLNQSLIYYNKTNEN